MHGDIVGRKLQAKRIQLPIQRASGAHNYPLNPSIFFKLPSQLINSISPKAKRVTLHRFIVHFAIVIRYVVVYRPSLRFRRRTRVRITRLKENNEKKSKSNSKKEESISKRSARIQIPIPNSEPLVWRNWRICSKPTTASSIRTRENLSGGESRAEGDPTVWRRGI